jgi:hypothetical protein
MLHFVGPKTDESLMTSVLLFIIVFFNINHANALDCMTDFQKKLKLFSSEPTPDALVEYQQKRFKSIYPKLFKTEVDPMETLELIKTLELLELLNNEKVLFSKYENDFSNVYQAFVKNGRDTSNLHDYFRSLVRGDPENAKRTGDLILSGISEGGRERFSQYSGIHSSKSVFWNDYKKPPELNSKLIEFTDYQNSNVLGFKLDVEMNAHAQKHKLVELTKSMEDVHGVQVVSVPQAIEKLSSNGFSIREAKFKIYKADDADYISAPMIVIPEKDLLYGRISSTATHEARHAYYATQREQYSTSPFDVSVQSINKKPLGEAIGYQHTQTYEEVSTHAKDLMTAGRTGNREILNLYKKRSTLLANEVFDLTFLNNKTNTVKKISEQTARTASEGIAEVKKLMKSSHEQVRDFSVVPTKEGYLLGFPVNDSFLMQIKFSSKSEKVLVKKFVDDYLDFQDAMQAAKAKGIPLDAVVVKKGNDALISICQLAEEKLSRSWFVANQVKDDAEKIVVLLDEMMKGNLKMDQDRYLKIRSIISQPARRVTGLSVRDPEEYQKAIQIIQKKRQARK